MVRRVRRKRSSTKRTVKSRPFGFVKVRGKYALVFGSRSKPRLSKKKFASKRALALYVKRKYMRR